jgi:hypothetical protein
VEQGDQSTADDAKAALDYAWNYFDRHAQQRQTVFNFYLIIIGASIAAYASTLTSLQHATHLFHSVIGAIVALASFVFWRLD